MTRAEFMKACNEKGNDCHICKLQKLCDDYVSYYHFVLKHRDGADLKEVDRKLNEFFENWKG